MWKKYVFKNKNFKTKCTYSNCLCIKDATQKSET